MKGTWDSDRDPLAALRDGDPCLFEAFVAAETPIFRAFFHRMGASRDEAEDLVQEVFLRMFRHAPGYRPTGKFQAFAYRVARNAWIDRQRRRGARPRRAVGGGGEEEPGLELVTADPAPEEVAEQQEEAGRVGAALARLPETHRLVFELGVVEELPYSEISQLLEIPEGTVKSRMFHAVRKLRDLLEGVRRPEEGTR